MKNKLPRGLTYDESRDQYRVQFQSKHTQKGKSYKERLPPQTTQRSAESYLAKLREDDRMGILQWPAEKKSEPVPEQRSLLSVGDFAPTYLEYCEHHNKPRTVHQKRHILSIISPWFWDVPLAEVTSELIKKFQFERKAEGVSARTVNLGAVTLHHLLTIAHEMGHLESAPPRWKKLPEHDKKQPFSLSVEEAQRALELAKNKGTVWYTLTLFLLHTGARWSETRELLWRDVDLQRNVVKLRAETAKQGRPREIPLVTVLAEALSGLEKLGEGERVFQHWHRGRWFPMPKDARLGKGYPWGDFGAHVWRHTFATWKLQAGISIALVSRWLGHRSIQLTVDTYGHIDGGQHHEEIEQGPTLQ